MRGSQRIGRIGVAGRGAPDRRVVPGHDGVEQAHAAAVRHQPGDALAIEQGPAHRAPPPCETSIRRARWACSGRTTRRGLAPRDRFQHRQCPRSRNARAQSFQARRTARGGRSGLGHRREVEREDGLRTRGRARRGALQQQGHAHHVGQRPRRMERLGIRRVAGDQQQRRVGRVQLRQRREQAGREALVVRAQAGGRLAAARRDVPVAGRGVVDRVGEARRRDQAIRRIRAAERFAQGMAVRAVAARGGEDAGERRRVEVGMAAGFVGGRHGDLHRGPGAAALCRRQARQRREHGGAEQVRRLAAQHRQGGRPGGEPRADQADAQHMQFAGGHQGAPRTRLALEPPKPNELLSTRRSGARRLAVHVLDAQRGVGLAHVEAARQQSVAQREQAQHGFDAAGGPERVPGRALGGTARHRGAEHGVHRAVLRRVVVRRRRAMQVDVVDLPRDEVRVGQRARASRRRRRRRPDAASSCGSRRCSRPRPAAGPAARHRPQHRAAAARTRRPRPPRCRRDPRPRAGRSRATAVRAN